MPPRQVPIGVIIAAHGLRGLVKVKTEAENFKASLEKQPVTIGDKSYLARWSGADSSPFIVRLEGVDDRNASEALKGKIIYITVDKAPASDAKEFVVSDLIGISVEEDGISIGEITKVFNFGAGDVVEIIFADGATEMFAFNARTFPEVDISAGRATLHRPEEI